MSGLNFIRQWRPFWLPFLIAFVVVTLCAHWMVSASLRQVDRPWDGEDFHGLSFHFEGQKAIVEGEVNATEVAAEAERRLRENIRVGSKWWSGRFNPVRSVENKISIKPKPPGFLFLVRHGGNELLAGETADAAEHDLLLQAAGGILLKNSDHLTFHSAVERGKSKSIETTVNSLKTLAAEIPKQEPVFLAGTIGEPVERIDPALDSEALTAKFSERQWPAELGMSMIRQFRIWTEQAAEEARLMALPLPHLTLMSLGQEIVIRGHVATAALKESVIAAAKAFYKERNVVDEIIVSNQRRPLLDAGVTLTSLPAIPEAEGNGAELLAFATVGNAWVSKPLDQTAFQAEGNAPAGLDATLFQEDLKQFATRHSAHLHAMEERKRMAELPASFIALYAAGNQVHLRGVVSSEAESQSIVKAAKQFYTTEELHSEIQVTNQRKPLEADQLKSITTAFPAALTPTTAGIVGFATMGKPWTKADVPPVELKPEEFTEFVVAKLLDPVSFPATDTLAIASYTAFAEAIAQHATRMSSLKLSLVPPQPYLAMFAFQNKIIFRGDAGSAKLKEVVIKAAREKYKDREVIDELRIDSDPPVFTKDWPGFTVKTFPPAPPTDGPGLFGFNLPGQPWLKVLLTWEIPTREWLESHGLFSKQFEASQAWPDYENWLPKLAERKAPETKPNPPVSKP